MRDSSRLYLYIEQEEGRSNRKRHHNMSPASFLSDGSLCESDDVRHGKPRLAKSGFPRIESTAANVLANLDRRETKRVVDRSQKKLSLLTDFQRWGDFSAGSTVPQEEAAPV